MDEFDASDRALIWAIHGGEQRVATGLADVLVEDDTAQMVQAIARLLALGLPAVHRSEQVDSYRNRIAALDPSRQWEPASLRKMWGPRQ